MFLTKKLYRCIVFLQVENTIRWRKKMNEDGTEATDELGKPIRESNARVVRWSDGRSDSLTSQSL